MRIIVCGGRDYDDYTTVATVLNLLLHPETLSPGARERTVIVHGDAAGADALAKRWAQTHRCTHEPHPYRGELGKAGGPVRNREMLAAGADVVVAFPGGRGTEDLVSQSKARGMLVLRVERPAR